MNIKQAILSSNYWVLNKTVVKELGTETALILTVLSEAENMFDGEWFYQTADTITELTGLSNHIQTKCINKLTKLNMLEHKNQGIPMKRYFKLNYEVISNQVFKEFESCNLKNSKTSISKTSNNKESINIESNNKEISNKYKENMSSKYKSIIDYLNEKTGKHYKHTTRKTQELIKARINEGFTEEDFFKVIDIKTIKWGKESKMRQYLRPETLFGTKFESYLNEEVTMVDEGILTEKQAKDREVMNNWLKKHGEL